MIGDEQVICCTKNESKDFRLRLWLDESYTEQTAKTFEFDIYLYAKNVPEDFMVGGAGLLKNAINVKEVFDYLVEDILNNNLDDQLKGKLKDKLEKRIVKKSFKLSFHNKYFNLNLYNKFLKY